MAVERTNEISQLAWDKFCTAVHALCSPELIGALQKGAPALNALHNEILERYQRYREIGMQEDPAAGAARGTTQEEFDEFRGYLNSILPRITERYDNLNESGLTTDNIMVRWSAISSNWNTLDQYVRLQRLERNLLWFDEDLDQQMGAYISVGGFWKNPINTFSGLHDYVRDSSAPSASTASIRTAIGAIRHDTTLTKNELDERILSSYPDHSFGHEGVEGYANAANDAAQTLREFLDLVDKVTATNWPESAREPIKAN